MKIGSTKCLPNAGLTIIVTFTVIFLFSYESNSLTLNSNGETIINQLQSSPSVRQEQSHNCPIPKGDEGESSTLQSVQIIVRHGVRTPLYEYPNDPYINHDYGVGVGELIPRGKYNSYLLGKCIRQSYDQLLGPNYSPAKLFCISSEEDRTQVTGLAGVAGYYPPNSDDPNSLLGHLEDIRWQPISCMTTQFLIDNKIASTDLCPAYLAEYQKYKASDESVQFINQHAWLYSNLTVLTGKTITDYDDVQRIYDTIIIQKEEFNLEYPPWFPPIKFAMKENNDFSWYAAGATRILLLARITPLMNQIANNFNSFTGQPNQDGTPAFRKSNLYAFYGHGTPMNGLAQVMDFYDQHNTPPYFNAVLSFELHLRDGVYYIKVFFKNGYDQPNIQKSIGGCPDPCTFDRFKEFYRPFMISVQQWLANCQIVVPFRTSDNTSKAS